MNRPANRTLGICLAAAALLLAALAPNAPANTISGAVRYRDKVLSPVDGTVTSMPMVPARYVALSFARASNLAAVLGSTGTDANGNFVSPNLGAFNDVVVLVKAMGTYQGQTAVVLDQSSAAGSIQTFQSTSFDLSAGNRAGQTIDMISDDISGAFNIYDVLIRARKFILESFFATPPNVTAFTITVRWEFGKDSNGINAALSEFFVQSGQIVINLLGDVAVDSDAFDDSVIAHEYGHLAAHLYSRDDSPGGAHNLGQTLDLRLAFSEGWADFFACAVNGSQTYVDTSGGVPLIFEINTPSVTGAAGLPVTGPDNELAVSAVLWGILSAGSVPISNGAIDTPREAIWDIFDRYLPTAAVVDICLEDFWDGFFVKTLVTPPYGTTGKTALINILNAHNVRYFVDSFEPNGSAAAASAIQTTGAALTATLYFDSNNDGIGEGDQDWFAFNAQAGTTYTIETLNLGNAADTVLQLYDTNGTAVLAVNDNLSVLNPASRIIYTFTAAGKYYAQVTRAATPDPIHGVRANYGSYDVQVTQGGIVTGPVVALINPVNGAANVATSTAVVATFSLPVQTATVTAASFTVKNGATAVAGTLSLNGSRTVATFTPASALAVNVTYAVALTASILDDQNRPLTAFASTFTTGTGTAPPPSGPLTRVPRAQAASGDGYVDVEWVYPATAHDGVIVAFGLDRFPTISLVNLDGTLALTVANGTELYRGNTDTQARISSGNGQRVFVSIWTYAGTQVSAPFYVSSGASNGGRGITRPLNPGTQPPKPGQPTLPTPAKFQVVSGDGFVDVEWVVAAGAFDGVIVAVGDRTFPKLEQVNDQGTLKLFVTRGTEVYRSNNLVRFRLTTGNGSSRLCCVWMYKGIEFSRPLYASTRASRGGQGLTQDRSFYGSGFVPPALLNQSGP